MSHIKRDNDEQPTGEFRQIKTPIKRGNGILWPGYREEIIGYDVTVQQKYIRRYKMASRYCRCGTWMEDTVWRDLPIEYRP